jgi:hypothetical protein
MQIVTLIITAIVGALMKIMNGTWCDLVTYVPDFATDGSETVGTLSKGFRAARWARFLTFSNGAVGKGGKWTGSAGSQSGEKA